MHFTQFYKHYIYIYIYIYIYKVYLSIYIYVFITTGIAGILNLGGVAVLVIVMLLRLVIMPLLQHLWLQIDK